MPSIPRIPVRIITYSRLFTRYSHLLVMNIMAFPIFKALVHTRISNPFVIKPSVVSFFDLIMIEWSAGITTNVHV